MADNLSIRFYQDKLLMGFASEQAGHPVFEDRDFREAYKSLVDAFSEEWEGIGKSPIDWGEYDSHKYEI